MCCDILGFDGESVYSDVAGVPEDFSSVERHFKKLFIERYGKGRRICLTTAEEIKNGALSILKRSELSRIPSGGQKVSL